MYQLLIVENEDIIRKGLIKIIQAMKLNIAAIHEAADGYEALKMMQRETIDLVVSDIKMPEMDGLTFIKEAKIHQPELEFIILSGYSEFDFATRALRYGVQEYLLKPVNKQKLEQALKKTIQSIEGRQEKQQKLLNYAATVKQLQQFILWETITKQSNPQQVEKVLAETNLTFSNELLMVLAFTTSFPAFAQESVQLAKQITDIVPVQFEVLADYGYNYLLLNPTPQQHLELVQLLSTMNHQKIQQGVHIGSSSLTNHVAQLPRLVNEARLALDNRLLYPTKFYFNYQQSVSHQQNSVQLMTDIQYCLTKHQSISACLLSYSQNQVEQGDSFSSEQLLLTLNQVEQGMSAQYNQQATEEPTTIALDFLLSTAVTLEEFIRNVSRRLHGYAAMVQQPSAPHTPVDQAITFIQTNFSEDISLEALADMVAMSPSYFSTLFKKTTGLTFVQYLQNIRIQQALKLLQDSEMKIGDIAELVGFHDEKYFFKVFKKITGYTPRQKQQIETERIL